MRKIFLSAILMGALVLSGGATTNVNAAGVSPSYVENPSEWSLFFQDEFNSDDVSSAWHKYYFGNYTDLTKAATTYNLEDGSYVGKIYDNTPYWNSTTAPGFKNTGMTLGNRDFTHIYNQNEFMSNHTPTMDQFVTKFGYYEMRAKLPSGSGLCPAWWLVGYQDEVSQRAEIDIFEYRGKNPNNVTSTLHPWADTSLTKYHTDYDMGVDISEDFHVFALEWDPNFLKFYVDGKMIGYTNNSPQYRMMMFISFNQHDNNSWLGPLDPTLPNPKRMEVDYVRIFKKDSWPDTTNQTTTSSNLALSAYASADNVTAGHYTNYPMYKMNDGNDQTDYVSMDNQKKPSHLYLDWTNEPVTFDTITLKSRFSKGQGITLFDVEVTDDVYSTWTTIASDVAPQWVHNDDTVESFSVSFSPVTKKYVRLKVKDYNNQWNHFAVSELEISEGAPKQNLALSSTVSATNENSENPVGLLSDSNLGTSYVSEDNQTFPQYVTFRWGEDKSFDEVVLKSWWCGGQAPTNWDIEVSEDGSTGWTKVASSGTVQWSSNDTTVEEHAVKFDKVTGKRGLRIKINDANLSWKHYAITEVEIFDN